VHRQNRVRKRTPIVTNDSVARHKLVTVDVFLCFPRTCPFFGSAGARGRIRQLRRVRDRRAPVRGRRPPALCAAARRSSPGAACTPPGDERDGAFDDVLFESVGRQLLERSVVLDVGLETLSSCDAASASPRRCWSSRSSALGARSIVHCGTSSRPAAHSDSAPRRRVGLGTLLPGARAAGHPRRASHSDRHLRLVGRSRRASTLTLFESAIGARRARVPAGSPRDVGSDIGDYGAYRRAMNCSIIGLYRKSHSLKTRNEPFFSPPSSSRLGTLLTRPFRNSL